MTLVKEHGFGKIRLPSVQPRLNGSAQATGNYSTCTNEQLRQFAKRSAQAQLRFPGNDNFESYFNNLENSTERRYLCSWHFEAKYMSEQMDSLIFDPASCKNPHAHVLNNYELRAKGLEVIGDVTARDQRVIDRGCAG